ncbi:hypothetical protein [Salmonella phage NINP13076]|nr:hypothetical protein [Salmonella phage NINP13076]
MISQSSEYITLTRSDSRFLSWLSECHGLFAFTGISKM